MFILGLTGSIGMGKTETARMFRRLGVPVYDADAAVHRLLGRGGAAVAAVEAAFPGVVQESAVDRKALGERVFGRPAALKKLESILHPMVGRMQRRFLSAAARRREPLVVLDVPLLFETNGEARTDAIAVVSAPGFVQRRRVLRRPGMSEEKLRSILRQQMPDAVKRARADYVIPAGQGRRLTFEHVARIVDELKHRRGHVWPPRGRPRPRPVRHPSRRPVHARNRTRH